MKVIFDPILGECRRADYATARTKTAAEGESGTVVIGLLEGGDRYNFSAPLRSLTVGSVENSPLESEIIFTATGGFIAATKIMCGITDDWDSGEYTLTQDNTGATGNDRTFSAEFDDDDANWMENGHWKFRAYVDRDNGKWTISTEFSCSDCSGELNEMGGAGASCSGVFAVASLADVELENVEWTDFDPDHFPRGNAIMGNAYVKTDGGNFPLTISIPATLGIIGTLPEFEAGKRYILNFRDNLVVGAEVTQ